MNPREEHISMFELDLHFVTGGSDERIDNHVAGCTLCGAYLAALDRLQTSAPLPSRPHVNALPAAAPQEPSSPPAAANRRPRPQWLGLALVAGCTILAAVSALLVVTRNAEPPAVAIKGSPAVQLLVRRGDQTRAWDGASRVRPGDALGLRVACDGYRRVTVAAFAREAGRWLRVSDDDCPADTSGSAALPFTLLVDDTPGRERFAVVFSPEPLDESALGDAIRRRRLDPSAWVARFELDKEVTP